MKIFGCLLVLSLSLLSTQVQAQTSSDSSGTVFWVMFMDNLVNPGPDLTLFISAELASTGQIEGDMLPEPIAFSVNPGEIASVSIPESLMVSSSDSVESKGLKITSDNEVTVYGLNQRAYSSDAFLALPEDILGTEYIVLDGPNTNVISADAAQFGIVASQDNTVVTIILNTAVGNYNAGEAYTVNLNSGESYQLQLSGGSFTSLSTTSITATQPISVFGGNRCTNLPTGENVRACDHVVEQLLPTSTWGTEFVSVPLALRENGDSYRFVVLEDGTDVQLDGVSLGTFNKGDVYDGVHLGYHYWRADAPMLLAQYSNSSGFDGVESDPFMMLIPPFEQHLNSYIVSTPAGQISENYLNIVARTADTGLIVVDGEAIPQSAFTEIGNSGFSGAQISVGIGTHNLDSLQPFGVAVYGFDTFESYGYPGGLALEPISVDTDGDGLLDIWETNGYFHDDDNIVDVDLPAMGADPLVPDIFIEVDWMVKEPTCIKFWCRSNGVDTSPSIDALNDVVEAFANAPSGPIRVHIDSGQNSVMNHLTGETWGELSRANALPYSERIIERIDNTVNFFDFLELKRAGFDDARLDIFHYSLYAYKQNNGEGGLLDLQERIESGISRGIPAADFVLFQGGWNNDTGFTRLQERGTFMHELGHNLSLTHNGGATGVWQNDPIYRSVMNYLYQHVGIGANQTLDFSGGTPYNDWQNLLFDGGAIGSLGDSQTAPTIMTIEDEELTEAEARRIGFAAKAGDGSVGFKGPSFLLPSVGEQQLFFDVSNASSTAATFSVSITGDLNLSASNEVLTEGYDVSTLTISVDTDQLTPGQYLLKATLSSDLGGDNLAYVEFELTVPDTQADDFQESLASIQEYIANDVTNDIDPVVRLSIESQIDEYSESEETEEREETVGYTFPDDGNWYSLQHPVTKELVCRSDISPCTAPNGEYELKNWTSGVIGLITLPFVDNETTETFEFNFPADGFWYSLQIPGTSFHQCRSDIHPCVAPAGEYELKNWTSGEIVIVTVPVNQDFNYECNGLKATIIGTEFNDVIPGTDNIDVIVGLGGDDLITGLAGDDVICGGSGNDIIDGGAGNDTIYGDAGEDEIKGGADNDRLFGGDDNDIIRGSRGQDTIEGGSGNDNIDAGTGDDDVKGGLGDDALYGGDGADYLRGSKGNDVIDGGAGDDQIFGGVGDDSLKGGLGNDYIDGGSDNDELRGSRGDDMLDGGAGDDTMNGGTHDVGDTCAIDTSDTVANTHCEQ